jgi:hypothetical protein
MLFAACAVPLHVAAGGNGAEAGNDWNRFGWNAARTNAPPFATGITATKLHTLVRRQVQLDGTVDSSPIYLHAVTVAGATHDTFFVTTTYGKTEAIDADTGSVLWRYTPPGYSSWANSAQITTATRVADPGRKWIYAASPGGAISIATTGGYIGDQPPYQGHVAVIQASNGALLHVWNSLCSNQSGLLFPASCPAGDSAIWLRAGAVVDPKTHDLLVATGNAPWDGKTNWGDAVLRLSPDAGRNGTGGTSPVVAGGLLWVYDPGGGLNVYAPAIGRLLATLPCGGGHWNSPIVVDGRIALAEGNANDHSTSGVLDIWRLP